jgi:hypothetical protein
VPAQSVRRTNVPSGNSSASGYTRGTSLLICRKIASSDAHVSHVLTWRKGALSPKVHALRNVPTAHAGARKKVADRRKNCG